MPQINSCPPKIKLNFSQIFNILISFLTIHLDRSNSFSNVHIQRYPTVNPPGTREFNLCLSLTEIAKIIIRNLEFNLPSFIFEQLMSK